ncbi:hypothetical protein ALNOE001_12010 [Candidatus Methanobinarius endosymbioticus]|uniref:DUF2283 domain-containing protein n=1 Tax=Candidatus Methanobinarius endosymbioticus TaxID=2006182 RepID=A0A366MA62_9EURY|nr:hypothetical protein ALNOE001_12010 [Candidatus Methanobinarius endosymbioticus]
MAIAKILNYEYDSELDALYIKNRDYDSPKATSLTDNIMLDLTEKEEVVGLEIINISHSLNTSVQNLEKY